MTNSEIIGGRLLPIQDLPLYRLAEEYCWRWSSLNKLGLRMVEPLRNHGSRDAFGWFDRGTKRLNIGIRFSHQGFWNAYPHDAFQILDTVAHELGHFKFFNHGRKHRDFYSGIRKDMEIEDVGKELQKLRKWLPIEERVV